MGRIAGVSAEETRQRLLAAAAAVFARRGYDGAAISEIAAEAGVTSGAIYAHFPSKAELFTATLHAHGSAEIERLLAVGAAGGDAVQAILERSVAMTSWDREEGSLLMEALVAAKRDPEVGAVLVRSFTETETRFAALLRAGQRDGTVDKRIRPAAVARFVSMVVLGSVMAAALDLTPINSRDWTNLINDLTSRIGSGPDRD